MLMATYNFLPRCAVYNSAYEMCLGRVNTLHSGYRVTHIKKLSNYLGNTVQWTINYETFHPNFLRIRNKLLTFNRLLNKATSNKYFSKMSENSSKFTFQQLLHFRKKQAECSILCELSSKDYIPSVSKVCEQFGSIENLYCYAGESGNSFLLLEFADEVSVNNLLEKTQCKNILDAFPISSRLIHFEKKFDREVPENVTVVEDKPISVLQRNKSVSEILEDVYSTEKLSELNTRLRYFFCTLIKESVSGLFPHCEVFPFGSSVNGIGRHGCDLDVIVRLYPEQVNSDAELSFLNKTCVGNIRVLQQKTVLSLGDFFRTFLPGVSSVQKIVHARMPILKLKHKILGMDCDISVNNMAALLMSEIIYFCGEVDSRVRPLMYAVKKWAKEVNITYETPGTWITNFGLSLLVIFFLQNRPLPLLPPLNDAVCILGDESSPNFKLDYLKSTTEWQNIASTNTESLAQLLGEFLIFLATFPFREKHLSILTGLAVPRNDGNAIYLQYPMEEDQNVTKNVSEIELMDMCEKAYATSKYLASHITSKVTVKKDFSMILGIPNIKKLKFASQKMKKINVTAFLTDDSKKHLKNKTVRRAF